jgi:hypothetical protein
MTALVILMAVTLILVCIGAYTMVQMAKNQAMAAMGEVHRLQGHVEDLRKHLQRHGVEPPHPPSIAP